MKTVTEAAREIDLLYDVDVVVVGGGPAGIGAALSAARNGAKTVLIENYGCLGGNQTLTLNNSFSFVDDRVQGGIIQELIDRLKKNKATFEANVGCMRDNWSPETGCYYFDAEYYKLMLEEMMEEAGVTLLYHAMATGGIVEGNLLRGVIVETCAGRQAILAKTVIDCSGCAHLAWRSGAECEGEEGYPDDRFGPFKGMHMGFGYGMFVYGMDYAKFRAFAEENEDEWDYWVRGRDLFVKCKAEGTLKTPRNSCLMIEYANGRAWILGPYMPIEKGHHTWYIEDIGKAEVEMRKQAWSIYETFKNNVPGFENAKMEQTPIRLLMRDSHKIVAEYKLTEEDIMAAKTFDDAIACCNMPPDPFFPNASHRFVYNITPYDIPYSSLQSKTYDNLLAAGGSASSDIVTWAAVRYCTPSVCTGQAAGTAAALASKNNTTVKDIDVRLVQKELNSQGMITTNKQISQEVLEQYKLRKKTWNRGLKL